MADKTMVKRGAVLPKLFQHASFSPPERESIEIGGYYADFSKCRTQFGRNPKTLLRESAFPA
jgi:hypothetical protein